MSLVWDNATISLEIYAAALQAVYHSERTDAIGAHGSSATVPATNRPPCPYLSAFLEAKCGYDDTTQVLSVLASNSVQIAQRS